MNALKSLTMGLILSVGVFLASTTTFAYEAQEYAKVLNDAVVALQQSYPDLAARLTKFAKEEAAEKEEKNDKNEPEGMMEKGMRRERTEHARLLRDSATALKTTHPELALSLMRMADHSEKKMEMKEEKEEQEAGEANEVRK